MTTQLLESYDGASDFNAAGGITLSPLANTDDLLGLRNSSQVYSTALDTGHLDIRNYHSLYLHSSSLTNYHSHGPLGVKSIISKINVTSQFGDMITKSHSGLVHDYVDCGSMTLRTLQFSLRDGNNREVDLRGGNLSFTLLFAEKPLI